VGSVERSGVPDELLQPVGGWRIERPMRDLQCLLVQRKSDGVDEVTLGGEAAVDGADSNLRAAGEWFARAGQPAYWPTRSEMRARVEAAGFSVRRQRPVVRLFGVSFPTVVTVARRTE